MPSARPLRRYAVHVLNRANTTELVVVSVEAPTARRAADEVAADYLHDGTVTAIGADPSDTFTIRRGQG